MRRKLIDDQVSLITGLGLGFTIAIQLTTLTRSDFADIYSQITTASRFFALIGSYLAIIGLLLIARISWIESVIGHDRLVTWHRKSMPYALYFITAHILLVVLGYAGGDQVRIGVELWTMITTYPWMLPATLGFIFLLVAGVTSYRVFRTSMSYETWWVIHLYTYLGVALSFMHQILTGSMFITHPLAKYYWISLYVSVVVAILFWRILLPLSRSIRHQLRVSNIVTESPGVVSIYIAGKKIEELNAQGGQFFSWRFLSKDLWFQSHPYSLSASPTNTSLRITVKALGDSSTQLAKVKKGTRVFIEGPYGIFKASSAGIGRHIVLVGGGVGITPLRAIMEEFAINTQIDVLYRASSEDDLVLRKELDELADRRGARVHYLVGSRKVHTMSYEYIKKFVPNFQDAEVFICGPEALVSTVKAAAKKAGIPKNRFHDEAFAFHGN
jgi:predicted ferric reductase